jgi:hypothetical protein
VTQSLSGAERCHIRVPHFGQKQAILHAPLNAIVSWVAISPTTSNRDHSSGIDIENALADCFLHSPQWHA